jgi:hypothetical protein
VHSPDLTASLAPILSRLYKNKISPFAWSIFTHIGTSIAMVFTGYYWSLGIDPIG